MIGHSTFPRLPAIYGLSLLLGPAASGCSKPAGPGDGEAKQVPQAKQAAEAEPPAAPRPLATPPTATAATRTLTFTNQCSFDVWIQSDGSNAANIPCTAVTTSAQSNCPQGFLCYDASVNTQFCVPGTTQATQFPITSQSDITLDPTQCSSGQLVTDTTSNLWGQCTCATSSDCAGNQLCTQVGNGVSQCFWGFGLSQGGHLTPPSGGANVDTVTVDISSNTPGAIVASGNFFAQLSCGVNDVCLSDGSTTPGTRIEYTLVNGTDFYDVSYINGMNVPAVMAPVPSTSLAYDPEDPYGCMAAGGDLGTLQSIAAFQRANGIDGNTSLQPFACTNDYDSTFVGERVGFNFVSPPPASPTTCTAATDCTESGTVCGLSLDAVTGKGTVAVGQLTCGQRLGYWSYTQLCAANSSFASTALGVSCSNAQARAYAECTNLTGVADQGPGRSCFNSNTTVSGDTCCGFEAWSFGGASQPLGVGQSAVRGVDTSFWTAQILPVVKPMKAGCPLAYSYQFDDPFATFTCTTTSGQNTTSYAITLCPSGDDAGVNPPPPAPCVATVPQGNDPNEFTVGVPAGITIAIDACDDADTCTAPLSPTAGSIYTATSATLYEITATNASSVQQVCQFMIPASGCITGAGNSTQPPCNLWQVATTGAWAGRSIGVPSI